MLLRRMIVTQVTEAREGHLHLLPPQVRAKLGMITIFRHQEFQYVIAIEYHITKHDGDMFYLLHHDRNLVIYWQKYYKS